MPSTFRIGWFPVKSTSRGVIGGGEASAFDAPQAQTRARPTLNGTIRPKMGLTRKETSRFSLDICPGWVAGGGEKMLIQVVLLTELDS